MGFWGRGLNENYVTRLTEILLEIYHIIRVLEQWRFFQVIDFRNKADNIKMFYLFIYFLKNKTAALKHKFPKNNNSI